MDIPWSDNAWMGPLPLGGAALGAVVTRGGLLGIAVGWLAGSLIQGYINTTKYPTPTPVQGAYSAASLPTTEAAGAVLASQYTV